jgi:hypothetical protein
MLISLLQVAELTALEEGSPAMCKLGVGRLQRERMYLSCGLLRSGAVIP